MEECMETIELDRNYSGKRPPRHYLEAEGEKSFFSIKQNRPLVFILKNVNKSFARESKEYLNRFNYTTQIIGESTLIGIRSDFHSLGFNLRKMVDFVTSINYKKELIEEEILAILHGCKEENPLKKKDEVEIISCFFE